MKKSPLGDVKEGFENCTVVALDGATLDQLIGGLGANDGDGFRDDAGEAGQELIARKPVTGGELVTASSSWARQTPMR